MTVHLSITCSVQAPPQDTAGMNQKELAEYSAQLAQMAQDRAADWFRGHPVRIHAKVSLGEVKGS
jgi:hypothetical protein